MEEAATRHAETVHYSTSARIRVGGGEARKTNEAGFWLLMLEGLVGARLRKEEADRGEKRVGEVTGWSDPVEEKIGFVEAVCQNYEALVEDKRVGKSGGAGPSQRYETRFRQRRNEAGVTGAQDNPKKGDTGRAQKSKDPRTCGRSWKNESSTARWNCR